VTGVEGKTYQWFAVFRDRRCRFISDTHLFNMQPLESQGLIFALIAMNRYLKEWWYNEKTVSD